MRVAKHLECPTCYSSGTKTCSACRGKGKVGGFLGIGGSPCKDCDAEGIVFCPQCQGLGIDPRLLSVLTMDRDGATKLVDLLADDFENLPRLAAWLSKASGSEQPVPRALAGVLRDAIVAKIKHDLANGRPAAAEAARCLDLVPTAPAERAKYFFNLGDLDACANIGLPALELLVSGYRYLSHREATDYVVDKIVRSQGLQALRVLFKVASKEAAEALKEENGSNEQECRERLERRCLEHASRHIDLVLELLLSEDKAWRDYSSIILGNQLSEAAYQRLVPSLASPTARDWAPRLRLACLKKHPESCPVSSEYWPPEDRFTAVAVISAAHPKNTVERLRERFYDPEPYIWLAAGIELSKSGWRPDNSRDHWRLLASARAKEEIVKCGSEIAPLLVEVILCEQNWPSWTDSFPVPRRDLRVSLLSALASIAGLQLPLRALVELRVEDVHSDEGFLQMYLLCGEDSDRVEAQLRVNSLDENTASRHLRTLIKSAQVHQLGDSALSKRIAELLVKAEARDRIQATCEHDWISTGGGFKEYGHWATFKCKKCGATREEGTER
jgi:hypothetical protein